MFLSPTSYLSDVLIVTQKLHHRDFYMFNEPPTSKDSQGSGSTAHQFSTEPDQSIQVSLTIPVARQTDVPTWFEQHVLNSILPPTTRSLITRIWITEAFDHFNDGEFELPEHLSEAQPGLLREWNRRNREASELGEVSKINSRKRTAEDTPGPAAKRGNNPAPIRLQNRQESIEGIRPLRKYDAIYTIGEVETAPQVYCPD